jgi:dTDP-4-amino-4,6-dideoxygalactose transaminase
VVNAHSEPAYAPGSWREAPGGLANSEQVSATALVLPLYHQMTLEDQDRVVDSLAHAVLALSGVERR